MDTAKHQETKALYRFGTFTLDVSEGRLWRGDEPIQLKPKSFDLLHYFVSNAGRVTKKNDILDAVWPDTFVEETTLARNVSWLRQLLETEGNGKQIIETVAKVGYRFTPEVSETDRNDLLIVEEQTVRYFSGEEAISTSPTRRLSPFFAGVVAGIVFTVLSVTSYSLYRSTASGDAQGPDTTVAGSRPVLTTTQRRDVIKVGSIVNLQSDGSFLDVWGTVWSKPEFRQVPTEKMFVSTHSDSNRDRGSGSWEVISASGKGKGEPLTVGDRIHLKNLYSGAGYLDTCGWVEHLRVFDDYSDQTAAVFTTKSSNRDNGSGTWTVRSATEADGNPVFEGMGIALESNLKIDDTGKVHIAGLLNVTGQVKDLPSFSEYGGSKLVFTKSLPFGQPVPDIWTIILSKDSINGPDPAKDEN